MKHQQNESEPGVVEKSVQLLKIMATAGKRGLPLTTLAQKTSMANSTVHRLLNRLVTLGMVVQNAANKRYALGPLTFELGLAAADAFDPREACRAHLQKLALEVGDTVYLTTRSGVDAVCVDRYEGPSPIRVITLDIGSRRPLGLGAGGLAILSFIPKDEREDLVKHLAQHSTENPYLASEILHESIEQCRQDGYSYIHNRVSPGVSAIGVPLLNSLDQPVASVSIAAINDRMPPARIWTLANILQARIRLIRASVIA